MTPNNTMHSCSKAQVNHVITLLNSGATGAKIASTTGLSPATISRICKKHCPDLEKSSGGRPAKLTTANIDYTKRAMRMGKIENATQAARILKTITNQSITPQTIRRQLKSTGWKAVVKKKRPYLSKRHKHARMEFAERHLGWTLDDWKHVIWSDETKINRFSSDGKRYVWKEAGEGLSDRLVEGTVMFGGGNVMV